jgi:hypothetical protein
VERRPEQEHPSPLDPVVDHHHPSSPLRVRRWRSASIALAMSSNALA